MEYDCIEGTFYRGTMATAYTDCQKCSEGYYCDTPGQATYHNWHYYQ